MSEDWFVRAIERVAEAGRSACREIDHAVRDLEAGRQARLSGRPVSEIVDELIARGGPAVRRRTAQAFQDYERAINALRAAVVRTLVDEHGHSFTEVARRLMVSRQAIARLYRQDCDDQEDRSRLIRVESPYPYRGGASGPPRK